MMLGASTGAWSKSGGGVPTTRDYVQDGLIVLFDGIENAGWDYHDSTLTEWKNLATGSSVLLPSGKYSVSDDSITITNNSFHMILTHISPDDAMTLEVVTKFASVQPSMECFIEAVTNNRSFRIKSVDPVEAFFIISGFTLDIAAQDLLVQEASSMSISIEGNVGEQSSISVNLNGVNIKSRSFTRVGDSYGGFTLGRAGLCPKCEMNSIRIYSRTLSADEIASNYAVDKARFNLA